MGVYIKDSVGWRACVRVNVNGYWVYVESGVSWEGTGEGI